MTTTTATDTEIIGPFAVDVPAALSGSQRAQLQAAALGAIREALARMAPPASPPARRRRRRKS